MSLFYKLKGNVIKYVKFILRLFKVEKLFRSFIYILSDFFSKDLISSNSKYKNLHKGETCFILGTGNSINNIDVNVLNKEIVFGSNFLINHKDFKKLKLDYYFEVDPIYELFLSDMNSISFSTIIKNEEDLAPYLKKNKNRFLYSVNPNNYFREIEKKISLDTNIFFNASSHNFILKNSLFKNHKISYIKSLKPMKDAQKHVFDISKRITLMDGCIFTMISTALYMGFNKIFLIGADYALDPSLIYHFYDQPKFLKDVNINKTKNLIAKFAKIHQLKVKEIKEDDYYYKPVFISNNLDYSKHIIVNKISNKNSTEINLVTPQGFKSKVYKEISLDNFLSKYN